MAGNQQETMKPVILLVGLLLASHLAAQQVNKDSLLNAWNTEEKDSIRWRMASDLVVYYLSVNVDSAKMWAEQGIIHARKLNSNYLISSSFKDKALAFMYEGDFDEALALSQQSLQMLEEKNDERNLLLASTVLGNIGLIFNNQKDQEKAAQYYKQALALKEQLKDSIGIARNLNNIGLAYFNTQQYDSALVYFEKTLQLSRQIKSAFGEGLSLGNIGTIYLEKRNFAKAKVYYDQALKIKRQLNDNRGISNILNSLGSIAVDEGNYSQSQAYYQEALSILKVVGDRNYLVDTYKGLSVLHEAMGDYKSALNYHKQYFALNDSLVKEANSESFNELEVRYRTKNQEVKLAQQELTISRQKSRQTNTLIGAGLLLLAALGAFQYWRSRERLRRQEAQLAFQLEKAEADKLREMDHLKSTFFANISHEFRTPLTLLLGPLEQLINGTLVGDPQKYFRIMQRNTARLLQLVNQLLDLSRLESGRMQLQVAKGDLAAFVRAMAFSFESLADRKQIKLVVEVADLPAHVWFDRDKLEKILVNLLSNAFKFTSEEGRVTLSGQLQTDEKTFVLKVEDTGIGIAPDLLPHVFERFYTTGISEGGVEGSGIGLALTRELVELHHGHIEVNSSTGRGACFVVYLPVDEASYAGDEKVEAVVADTKPRPQTVLNVETRYAGATSAGKGHQPIVLIVEDNADVRAYVADQLREGFRILEAANGREGLETARETIPDLIITDLMMPEMDGMQLCNLLKTTEVTSHIPIIMLTAKGEQSDKLAGLQTGADDYLIKPFDAKELRVRVSNLIEQRRLLRARFAGEVVFKPSEVAVTSVDESFLQRVLQTVEENLDEETFGVVELANAVGMSRSQLHRKLTALAGKGPNEVIRDMRLQRAKELLEKGAGNASEVAYMVGFNSLAYFSKCFSDRFGLPPSEFVKSNATQRSRD